MITSQNLLNSFIAVAFLVGCSSENVTTTPDSVPPQVPQPAPTTDDFEAHSDVRLIPTFTSIPSATPDITQTALVQDMVTARSAEQTLIAQFPHVCDIYHSPPKFSPNGVWLVELCYSENDRGLVLVLSNKEQVLWKFLYQDYLPQMDFVPDGGMGVVHWSKDGRYAYFISHLGGDGGECFYNGYDRGAGLFRVDLETGVSTAILPVNNQFWWYGFSFSPTDRRLVYGIQAKDLKILDMMSGKTIDILSSDNIYETGGYLWSDDGLKLVYSVLTRNGNGEREKYSLRLVDIQSGNEQILLETADGCFNTLAWSKDNILHIQKNYGESLIEFDLNSKIILSEATVTPYP